MEQPGPPPPPPPSAGPPAPPPPPPNADPPPLTADEMRNAPQGPVSGRGTMVDVRVACRDLISMEAIAPNSFFVIYTRTTGKFDWVELTRSETVRRNPHPDFNRIAQLEYRFELYQQVRVVVFERCTESDNLQQQALIGVADCTLGAIVSAQGAVLEISLLNVAKNQTGVGRLLLRADEIVSAKKMVTLEIELSGLVLAHQIQQEPDSVQAMQVQAGAPIEKPKLPRKGAAALFNRRKKDSKAPAVVPAHMQNKVQEPDDQPAAVQQRIDAYVATPTPTAPYLVILRAPPEASAAVDYRSPEIRWTEVFRSADINNYDSLYTGVTLKEFTLSEFDMSEGDPNRLLKFAIRPGNAKSEHDFIGEHITTFPALRRVCFNNSHRTDLSLHPGGVVTICKYSERVLPTFLDYIKGGWCDFGLICAIDFTASNGDPRVPGTRHFNGALASGSAQPNEYEAAMRTVANMLAVYSSDRRIPAYGFGANLPPHYNVSHCFPVTETELGDPFCDGVEGLMRAYMATLNRVQLYGPTIFSEVLRTVSVMVSRRSEAARQSGGDSLAYTVLLIMTDGMISDYDATLAELIQLSALPLSIVILGIGNDHGRMENFDAKHGLLRRGTDFALREFVQFVPYDSFKGDLSALAEKVLGAIPDQVLSYVTKVHRPTTTGS